MNFNNNIPQTILDRKMVRRGQTPRMSFNLDVYKQSNEGQNSQWYTMEWSIAKKLASRTYMNWVLRSELSCSLSHNRVSLRLVSMRKRGKEIQFGQHFSNCLCFRVKGENRIKIMNWTRVCVFNFCDLVLPIL